MQTMNDLISIIIPVYNTEKYLHKCLNSIISQKYENIEILLINDGSKDNSLAICKEFASKDSRIILIDKPNGGQSSARNTALNLMKGSWVMFVDSDDEIHPDMISIMYEYATINSCEIVRCNCVTRSIKGDEVRKLPLSSGVYEREKINELVLKDILGSQPWFGLYRSYLWENIKFPEGRIYEDLAILFKVYYAGTKPVGIIDKPLYIYNIHEDSTSFSISPSKNYDRFLAFKEHSDFAKEKKLPYEDYCFHQTSITAIGTFNYYIRYKNTRIDKEKLNNIFHFLKQNKNRILQDKYNSIYHKIMFRVYFISPYMYKYIIYILNIWRS